MNAKQKSVEKLAEAANHMQKAIDALQAIKDDAECYRLVGPEAGYYRCQLEELLSCDGGEAGLHQLISLLERRGWAK